MTPEAVKAIHPSMSLTPLSSILSPPLFPHLTPRVSCQASSSNEGLVGSKARRSSTTSAEGLKLSAQEQMNLDVGLKKASIDRTLSDSMSSLRGASGSRYGSKEDGESDGRLEDSVQTPAVDSGRSEIREVIRSSGLVFSEKDSLQFVLSKPKIMPLKSRAVEAIEKKMEGVGEVDDN